MTVLLRPRALNCILLYSAALLPDSHQQLGHQTLLYCFIFQHNCFYVITRCHKLISLIFFWALSTIVMVGQCIFPMH